MPGKRPGGAIGRSNAHKRYEFGTKVSVAPRPKAASSSACGQCRATLTMDTPCTRRWNRWRSRPAGARTCIRRSRLPRPWRRDRQGLHQRCEARRHQDGRETASTTKCHRADDRPHEDRWPPDLVPAEGHDRRRPLCGAVRLRIITSLRHLRVIFCQFIWLITLIRGSARRAGSPQALQIAA